MPEDLANEFVVWIGAQKYQGRLMGRFDPDLLSNYMNILNYCQDTVLEGIRGLPKPVPPNSQGGSSPFSTEDQVSC
jgi:hypothetical protein